MNAAWLAAEADKWRLAAEGAMAGQEPEAAVRFYRLSDCATLAANLARLADYTERRTGKRPAVRASAFTAFSEETVTVRDTARFLGVVMDSLEKSV